MDIIILNIVEVLNDPMDEDDIIDTNDQYEINRLMQDTFSPLDEDNLHDSHDVPLLEKSQNPEIKINLLIQTMKMRYID